MKRISGLVSTIAIIAALTIIAYGNFEKVDSENALTCQRSVTGYVYCDIGHEHPCGGAYVVFADIWEHGNSYDEFTNSSGYFDLGYIACDDYLVTVNCGDDCVHCYYVDVDQNGCHMDGNCTGFHFVDSCILHVHTNPDLCPTSK